MFQVILIVKMALNVHIAGVPIPHFGYALRTPMRPDTQFGIPVPFWDLITLKRIPICVKMGFYILRHSIFLFQSPHLGLGHFDRPSAAADIQLGAQQYLLWTSQLAGHVADQDASGLVAHFIAWERDGR